MNDTATAQDTDAARREAEDKAKFKATIGNREWRLDNLYFIKDEAGNKVKFVRNEAQRAYSARRWWRDAIVKARQLGFSTFIAILILDLCMFRKGQTAGVIDVTLTDAKAKLSKIKFAYENLPETLRAANPLVRDNQTELEWANGSKVSVGTSYRGGTLQFLHVSEYGKISVDNPDGAKEIKTGAFNAVPIGKGVLAVESTAHGTSGEFYAVAEEAKKKSKSGLLLTPNDFRLHFFGWWIKPEYRIANNLVLITEDLRKYFAEVAPVLMQRHGVVLDADQQAWYASKYGELGPDDMKSEYPTIVEETFFNSLEGAFWKRELSKARQEGRIGQMVPHDPTRRVNTFWDIGEDCTALWFHQSDGVRHRLIDYWEEEGSSLQRAISLLGDKQRERSFIYGAHYGPHDMDHRSWENKAKTRKEMAEELGIKFTIVPRVEDKDDSIEAGRRFLATSFFCAQYTGLGVERLDNYRKRWNKTLGRFTGEPLHDMASHGADSYQTGAMGYAPEKTMRKKQPKEERRGTFWSA